MADKLQMSHLLSLLQLMKYLTCHRHKIFIVHLKAITIMIKSGANIKQFCKAEHGHGWW